MSHTSLQSRRAPLCNPFNPPCLSEAAYVYTGPTLDKAPNTTVIVEPIHKITTLFIEPCTITLSWRQPSIACFLRGCTDHETPGRKTAVSASTNNGLTKRLQVCVKRQAAEDAINKKGVSHLHKLHTKGRTIGLTQHGTPERDQTGGTDGLHSFVRGKNKQHLKN